MNDGGDCRTARATPGLLKSIVSAFENIFRHFPDNKIFSAESSPSHSKATNCYKHSVCLCKGLLAFLDWAQSPYLEEDIIQHSFYYVFRRQKLLLLS